MSRRRKHGGEAHGSSERWLLSYADFITLLFAFFVVMYAHSQVDKDKAKKVSESVKASLENGAVAAAISGFLGRAPDLKANERGFANPAAGPRKDAVAMTANAAVAELMPSIESLRKEFEKEIAAGKIQLELTPRGLVVSMKEAAFFPPAGDVVEPAAYPMIERLSRTLRGLPNPIRLEGHTDSTPIHSTRFRSNWELAAARSIAMMELLSSRYEIPQSRMAVAGYADTVPLAPNDTAAGRARNRRVDIILLNEYGQMAEPVPAKAASTKTSHGKPSH